jgi:hypothetical protein
MSAYQMVVTTVYRGIDLAGFKTSFWKWWTGLYAEPKPRKFTPYL